MLHWPWGRTVYSSFWTNTNISLSLFKGCMWLSFWNYSNPSDMKILQTLAQYVEMNPCHLEKQRVISGDVRAWSLFTDQVERSWLAARGGGLRFFRAPKQAEHEGIRHSLLHTHACLAMFLYRNISLLKLMHHRRPIEQHYVVSMALIVSLSYLWLTALQ